jgi:hypothetical protein
MDFWNQLSLPERILIIGPLLMSGFIWMAQGGRYELLRRKKQLEDLSQQAKDLERQERIRNARLGSDQRGINRRGVPRNIGRGLVGYYMLVGTGTYGQNMLVTVLRLLDLCGLAQLVGTILLIQHNQYERDRFLRDIPDCYRARVAFGFSPSFTGGMANKPVAEVIAHIDRWAAPLVKAAQTACYQHEYATTRLPGQIIFFWSEGGQAPVALPVIEVLHKQFPEAQIVGLTSLPAHGRNRQKFAQLKAMFEDPTHGVAGWVLTDNLRPDWKNVDYCIAGLLVALSDAQLHDDETVQLNNVLALAFTERRGSVLAIQYVAQMLPAFEWMVEDYLKGYWIYEQRLVEAVQLELRELEEGRGASSVFLPVGEPGTSVFDVVMVNVGYDEIHDRDDLQTLSDAVHEGYRHRLAHLDTNGGRPASMYYGLANYSLKFGTLAAYLDRTNPACRVLVVRLAAIKDGHKLTDDIASIPDNLLLPYEPKSLPVASPTAAKQRGNP